MLTRAIETCVGIISLWQCSKQVAVRDLYVIDERKLGPSAHNHRSVWVSLWLAGQHQLPDMWWDAARPVGLIQRHHHYMRSESHLPQHLNCWSLCAYSRAPQSAALHLLAVKGLTTMAHHPGVIIKYVLKGSCDIVWMHEQVKHHQHRCCYASLFLYNDVSAQKWHCMHWTHEESNSKHLAIPAVRIRTYDESLLHDHPAYRCLCHPQRASKAVLGTQRCKKLHAKLAQGEGSPWSSDRISIQANVLQEFVPHCTPLPTIRFTSLLLDMQQDDQMQIHAGMASQLSMGVLVLARAACMAYHAGGNWNRPRCSPHHTGPARSLSLSWDMKTHQPLRSHHPVLLQRPVAYKGSKLVVDLTM